MVQSNYTVSTAQQLLGCLPAVRVSGSKSTSISAADHAGEHAKAVDRPSRGPAPTKPLPPTPLNTVRVRASRSSDVLAVTDKVKITSVFPAVVTEGEVLKLPASIYTPTTPTPTTPRAKRENVNVDPAYKSTTRVPVIETPRKGRSSPELEKRISQYYEYITPPISLNIGRTDSCRERKASHTPTSSAGSEIYFSPIDATKSQVFLSSPQPSPPISPADVAKHDGERAKMGEVIAKKVAELAIETVSAKEPEAVEIASVGRSVDGRKVTLTLAHVDRITTALARAPLVQMRVRGSHLDALPENMTSPTIGSAPENNTTNTTPSGLPTPPPSEASTTDSTGGIALLNTAITGAPITLTSTDAFTPGKCTHLSLPYGLSTTSTLRIEPAETAHAESKIILQSLFATFDRKTHARADSTLLAETEVTPSFARAALTELAAAQNLTLDDIEIRTPTATAYSPDGESIDWCAIGREEETRSPGSDILHETLEAFASPSSSSTNNAAAPFSTETCTMQTLTLLSELSRLQTAHATFLILQPARFDTQGALAGVKIPLVSRKLQERFDRMGGSSSSSTSTSSASSSASHGGLEGRLFREAAIAAVAPRLAFGEEFETFVGLGKGNGRVRARCVPMFGGEGLVERWVCFLGGEFDVPY